MEDHRDIALQNIQDIMDEASETMKSLQHSYGTDRSTSTSTIMEELERTGHNLQDSYNMVQHLQSEGKASPQDLHNLQQLIHQFSKIKYAFNQSNQSK